MRRGRLSRVPGRRDTVLAELTDGRWLAGGLAGGCLNLAVAGSARAAVVALERGELVFSRVVNTPTDRLTDADLVRLSGHVVDWRLGAARAKA